MYAENLKKIRKNLKYSVEELAEIIKIPARTIGGYERKERNCSIELVTQLCNNLNVNANWFVTGKGDMFNNTSIQNDLEKLVTQIVDKKMKERGL